MSALEGDNIVHRSDRMSWYRGPSLLEYLEEVPVEESASRKPFRFAVQRVVRPDHIFRGYAGTIASGEIKPGDTVTVWPSGRETRIASISTWDGELDSAQAGQAVTLTLSDELDLSRGNTIAAADFEPEVATAFRATLVWLNETSAQTGKRYRIKQATHQGWAELAQIEHRININTLEKEAAETLEVNSISVVRIETARPLVFDPYAANRITGSFILIDPATNATVAAGMIDRAVESTHRVSDLPAQFTWQIKDRALVVNVDDPQFAAETDPRTISDPEAADLLQRLLERLHKLSSTE